MPRIRSSVRIQRRTIVKRTRRPRVHTVRPVFPAVVVSPAGEVSAARSQNDAIAEAERMLLGQLAAERKPLMVIARAAAAMAAGARS
jgi:hypothetical protein